MSKTKIVAISVILTVIVALTLGFALFKKGEIEDNKYLISTPSPTPDSANLNETPGLSIGGEQKEEQEKNEDLTKQTAKQLRGETVPMKSWKSNPADLYLPNTQAAWLNEENQRETLTDEQTEEISKAAESCVAQVFTQNTWEQKPKPDCATKNFDNVWVLELGGVGAYKSKDKTDISRRWSEASAIAAHFDTFYAYGIVDGKQEALLNVDVNRKIYFVNPAATDEISWRGGTYSYVARMENDGTGWKLAAISDEQ